MVIHHPHPSMMSVMDRLMQNAWRFVGDDGLRERLKEAKGIGTAGDPGGNHRGAEEAGVPGGAGQEHRADALPPKWSACSTMC